MMLGQENIHYDPHSNFTFDQLNESLFIERLLENLMLILGLSFEEYEFWIFSNQYPKKILPESINYSSRKKKVLLYFSDESGMDPASLADSYFAIFKSYMPKHSESSNVFPLALGYVRGVPELSVLNINERKYNVFFQGNLNKNRIEFYRNFSSVKGLLPSGNMLKHGLYRELLIRYRSDYSSFFPNSRIVFNRSFKSGVNEEVYGEVLRDSKVVLFPRGVHSCESFRHYEAMRAGCVILSEQLPRNHLYEGSPIIEVENWSEGLKSVEDLLMNKQKLEKIQKEMVEWWNTRCSEKATAHFISSSLKMIS